MPLTTVTPGVYAPVLTFFHPGSEDVDLDTFKAHVRYLLDAGVGPVVCGSMSEAPMLSEAERLALVTAARSVIDEAGPNLGRPLVVGAGLASTRETIALTRKVAEAGADAVLIIPSGYFASLMTRDALKHFFIDVAAASPVPVLMYNFPGAAGGVDMDSVLIEEVATAAPNIVGAKLTCSQIGKFTRLAADLDTAWAAEHPRTVEHDGVPPFIILSGLSDFMVPALFAGTHGTIAGVGNFAPRSLVRLYDLTMKALHSGRHEDLRAAQALQAIMASGDYHTTLLHIPGAKRILQYRKGYGGLPREPIRPVDEAAYAKAMAHPAVKRMLEIEDELEAAAGGELK